MLRILMTTSEAVPFAKAGGLAEFCEALPVELARLGHKPTIIMPAYRSVYQSGQPLEETDIHLEVPIGNKVVRGRLLESRLRDSEVPVYLVEQDDYFNRSGIYGENGEDYRDNCQRFIFFCRAALEAVRLLELDVDLLHANDWPTGLIPAYLDIEYRGAQGYEHIGSLLTIHNMAYQGRFWHWDMLLTGLDWKYFNWQQMEYFGELNLLKTGIVFADAINTVSPRYALEIQKPPHGCGLEGALQQRRDVVSGIVNGVNYDVWNPANDIHIESNYDASSWQAGKSICKAALQRMVGLPEAPRVPLIGMISRLSEQNGWDLVCDVMDEWVKIEPVQWVILGSGDSKFQDRLHHLSTNHPRRVAMRFEFNHQLVHAVEAGADMFLAPSRHEPCGSRQLHSLKYGTVPVVRATGGLADTITDAGPQELAADTANGFVVFDDKAAALELTLRRACQTYQDHPETWHQLVSAGMKQDWSWSACARQYVQLYQQTISRVNQTVCA